MTIRVIGAEKLKMLLHLKYCFDRPAAFSISLNGNKNEKTAKITLIKTLVIFLEYHIL